jgi:hypothetical protein
MVDVLEVLFQPPAESPILKCFRHKPLGLFYKVETPIVVTLVMGEAEEIGVQEGWEVLKVGDQDLKGLSFEESCRILWEGADALSEAVLRRQYPPDTACVSNMILWWRPPAPSQAAEILQSFGYSAGGPRTWNVDAHQPRIVLQLADKHMAASCPGELVHTWYELHGRLSSNTYTQDWLWIVPRRLMHLRRLLHDPVRLELGRAYHQLFKTEKFACRGRPPGTTARLAIWLAALARVMNECQLSPALTASILCFLEAPRIVETGWNEALLRGRDCGRLLPEQNGSELGLQPDESSEDADLCDDLWFDDDDTEMPSHPPTFGHDGDEIRFECVHQDILRLCGHRIVSEVI